MTSKRQESSATSKRRETSQYSSVEKPPQHSNICWITQTRSLNNVLHRRVPSSIHGQQYNNVKRYDGFDESDMQRLIRIE